MKDGRRYFCKWFILWALLNPQNGIGRAPIYFERIGDRVSNQ